MSTLAIIPARGGSKGIPRKNLRPVNGKPLLFYSIQACLMAEEIDAVVVSTDDDEIALFAERFGAKALIRPQSLSGDEVTIDPVVIHATEQAELQQGTSYDFVITVQPTSPLIRSVELDEALLKLKQSDQSDSILSVVDDRHLCWTTDGTGKTIPEYEKRVNRQHLPARFKETGALIACRRNILDSGTRIGNNILLYEMPPSRSFDIDSYTDLVLCEAVLRRKRIAFVVTGSKTTGTGHAYRALLIANELVHHDLCFIMHADDTVALDIIRSHNYETHVSQDIQTTIQYLKPDLVINDTLDTAVDYVNFLKHLHAKVVTFEDLGGGADISDLVINALYPSSANDRDDSRVKTGPQYFCLRDEFIHLPPKKNNSDETNLLLTFGGVDEGNLSLRCLKSAIKVIKELHITCRITVIVGSGYQHFSDLTKNAQKYQDIASIEIIQKTQRISDFMVNADFAITSGGRTVLELASTTTPMIVICQNQRETSHDLLKTNPGIINLGLRTDVIDSQIEDAINRLLSDKTFRSSMEEELRDVDLTRGKQRVIGLINDILGN
ncbi:hypothetical protein BTA51_25510 [Hahella sp. CCB-MM4]|uniref:cytidylyltransferase domain-containing protein n=1 Tax=Hahella sp. (strain CCB-MM4) TaxID=1926491 RepID=UPI000B9A3586|nr:hypothetical protein [Hahella sp. CCB-MM4]OZG70494.1 hypothetical protein BTA51_25510 [Hahella sp. CCB-MM4]